MGDIIYRLGYSSAATQRRVSDAMDEQENRAPHAADLITSSGRLVSTDPGRLLGLQVADIAHALSQICRFGGHTPRFYSVAEHAVLVSVLLEASGASVCEQFAGLHHDDAEVLTGDIPRPRKTEADYDRERRLMPTLITDILPIDLPMRDVVIFKVCQALNDYRRVATADNLVLAAEMRAFWGPALRASWVALEASPMGKHPGTDDVYELWVDQYGEEPEASYLERHEELLARLEQYGESVQPKESGANDEH